jgi:hypothetical protein
MTPLHSVGDFFRELLGRVPLWFAQAIFIAVPLVLLAWLIFVPRSQATPENGGGWFSDLRLWAAAALMLQTAIYALF